MALLKTGDPHLSLVHSASCGATTCIVCKSPCQNYCTVCSEIANGMWAEVYKQGILKHMYNH